MAPAWGRQRDHLGFGHDCGAVLLHAWATGTAESHRWPKHSTRRHCGYGHRLCCAGGGPDFGWSNRQCGGQPRAAFSGDRAWFGRSYDDQAALCAAYISRESKTVRSGRSLRRHKARSARYQGPSGHL